MKASSENIKLTAVGDINLGDRAVMVGLGVNSRICQDPAYDPLGKVRAVLKDGDLTFGNLECVVSQHGHDREQVTTRMMRAMPKSLRFLTDSGFNALSIANNHIMQHGRTCFQETVQNISSIGILSVGLAGKNGKCIPQMTTIKGVHFCLLGYCLRPEKYVQEPLYAHAGITEILHDIDTCRRQCDFLVISMHWGEEYVTYPAAWQIEVARMFIDRGASLILGHHSHVPQGVEHYNGGVIAYSLGNFVFDVWQRRLRESMILNITFAPDRTMKVDRIPVYISADFSPECLAGIEKSNLENRFALLDEKIRRYPESSIFSEKKYAQKVRLAERINKLQNRYVFLKQLPSYEPHVRRQCLSNFFLSRVGRD